MNILVLGHGLPVSRRGHDATRELRFVRLLATRHRVTLAFTTDEPDPGASVSALRAEVADIEFAVVPHGWKCLSSALSALAGESCTLAYFRSAALSVRLGNRLRNDRYDLAFVSGSSMIPHALELPAEIPLVVDFAEVASEWWRRKAESPSLLRARFYRTEAARLRLAEAVLARRAAARVAGSPAAARLVTTLADGAPVTTVSDGIDLDYFSSVLQLSASPRVAFVSAIETDADVDQAAAFLLAAVPAVRRRIPGARFVVVGREAPASVTRLGQIPGVELALPPADLRAALHRTALAVAPLAPDVFPSSVLEAMATALPVVTTPRVRDALGAGAGRGLDVAEDPLAFAQHVVALLGQPSVRAEMGAQGRTFVRTHHSWDVAAARFARIVDSVLAGGRTTATRSPVLTVVAP